MTKPNKMQAKIYQNFGINIFLYMEVGMLAKETMAALCAHVDPNIARNAYYMMVIQNDHDSGSITADEAATRMTNILQQFVETGDINADNAFKNTAESQIQELK